MIDRQERIQRYSDARRRLDQLIAFAEAIRPHVPADVLAAIQAEGDEWLAQLGAYQTTHCQRCGASFTQDVLGLEAYAVANGIRLCRTCYDEIAGDRIRAASQLARLIVFAQEHLGCCAEALVRVQRERQLSDRQLATWLGLDIAGVLRLALWPAPRAAHRDADIAQILAHIGGNPETIRELIAAAPATEPPADAMNPHAQRSAADAAERCARYRRIASALVRRMAEPLGLDAHGVEGFLLTDDEHGRYLAMNTDRQRGQWRDAATLHIHVPDDGQVIVEWNGTEEDIRALLIAAGVQEEHISRSWLQLPSTTDYIE